MDICILSNINLGLLIERLSKKHRVYKPDGYGVWVQEISHSESGLYAFKPEAVFIILDASELLRGKKNSEEADVELINYLSIIDKAVAAQQGISFFVSSLDLPEERIGFITEVREERLIESQWYKELCTLTSKYQNAYIFDLKRLYEALGKKDFYSAKLWYLAGMKFSVKAQKIIEESILEYINALEGIRKKCIVLDLDNTLWGGILGEVGADGIELSEYNEGARYKDFQKRLKEIKSLGIILAISSKNNYSDAVEIIHSHKDMVLRENDFVSMKINWNSKAENIREIANELNIGLDSIIFIDDSPFERENVKSELPEVCVPEFPKDTSQLTAFITEIYNRHLQILKLSEEDRVKTEMYRNDTIREGVMKSATSFEDFLSSLKMKIIVHKADNKDIQRISQLTQKTNQFNLTTKRYTEADIKAFINSSEFEVYVAAVEDKFGDIGKVGVIIIKKSDPKTSEIDTFLLSCRAMGRYIEDQFISYVEENLEASGCEMIKAGYIPTSKNKPVENLYSRLGYEEEKNSTINCKQYKLFLPGRDTSNRKKFSEVIEL